MSAGRWVTNSAKSVISTTACSSILSTPKAASTANSRLDLAEVKSTPESISASAKAAEMSGSRLPTIRFSISTEGGRGHRICHGHHQAGQGRRCNRGGVDPACGRQPRLQILSGSRSCLRAASDEDQCVSAPAPARPGRRIRGVATTRTRNSTVRARKTSPSDMTKAWPRTIRASFLVAVVAASEPIAP